MRLFDKYRTNIYSQTGEDGLLSEIFRRLKIDKGTFCEFGANDGKFCSNARALLEMGWTGKFIEADPVHAKTLIDNTIGLPVELYFGPVTTKNINGLVPQQLDLLSIDVDNEDLHLWNAYNGEAKVVVIEVNSSIAPPEIVVPGSRGSSYQAMVMLGIAKGYFLIAHSGNCVFVSTKYWELFPEITADPIKESDQYFSKEWL